MKPWSTQFLAALKFIQFVFILGDVFLSDLSHVVVDEADTMFDASFVSMAVEILKYAGVCSCYRICFIPRS